MKMLYPLSKKIFALLFSVVFVSILTPALSSADEVVSVKGDNVNVRTGPSTNKPVYMELTEGYPLKIVKRQGEWVKVVDYEHDSGWIHQSLIGDGNKVIVNGKNKINMRSKPSAKSARVAEVYRGVVLTKIGEKDNWCKVRHDNGMIGWIWKPLLWP